MPGGGPVARAASTMSANGMHSADLKIMNRLGFHIRPVQRFAEMARAFRSDVLVKVEQREAPGKSVMNLMGLGGRFGDAVTIVAEGEDSRQCICVLRFLVSEAFFVEDDMDIEHHPLRHLKRLVTLASCFESDIAVEIDGRCVSATDFDALKAAGVTPASEVDFKVEGADHEQAREVLGKLRQYRFYIEEELTGGQMGEAH